MIVEIKFGTISNVDDLFTPSPKYYHSVLHALMVAAHVHPPLSAFIKAFHCLL